MRTWLCAFAILLSLGVAAQSGTDPGDECPGCMEPAACNYRSQRDQSPTGPANLPTAFIIANNDVVTD
jgi:hypothetical protein